ncbi:MAG: carbon-nitrogen hydrolase family protein [Candidatus Accumulibacter sp.]|nr:carbon-nitrogen hydrolase family protein [Accumulibacter sp.]
MDKIFRVAAVQMDCAAYEPERNFATAERLLQNAAARGAVLAVLPELFNTGYRVEDRDRELAHPVPGAVTERMSAIGRTLDMFIAGAVIERDGERLYDTAILVGPDGFVGSYRKNNLWAREVERFARGETLPVHDIGFCRLGLQICYDIGFPEGARILSIQGADIVAYTSAFGMARLYAWDLASRARALENGSYVIACNRCGVEKGETQFAGASRIIGPRGNVLASAGDGEDVIVAEVDFGEMRKQRSALPYLKNLRRDIAASYYRA